MSACLRACQLTTTASVLTAAALLVHPAGEAADCGPGTGPPLDAPEPAA
jgi:hypothetical protein